MTARKPVVLNAGKLEQLQSGDVLDAPATAVDIAILANHESSTPITIGTPVYIDAADGVKIAQANAVGTKDVIGLCRSTSITAGQTGEIQTDGQLPNTNWVTVAGTTLLDVGAYYYLSGAAAGSITSVAPVAGWVVEIGNAFSASILDISIRQPIKL